MTNKEKPQMAQLQELLDRFADIVRSIPHPTTQRVKPIGDTCIACGADITVGSSCAYDHFKSNTTWFLCNLCSASIESEQLTLDEKSIARSRAFLTGYAKGYAKAKGWPELED